MSSRPELAFASPRKLPRARDLKGRVVVLDVAFASDASSGGFEKITLPFIEQLGPRLAGWVDHHDHVLHVRYRDDPRFVLATKAEHGACPEMVTPAIVERIGQVDTIVCHTDFDGLCSAAKWLRAWTPQPTNPRLTASGRARCCAATALMAAVRVAVIQSPSITASGCPLWRSDRMTSAEIEGALSPVRTGTIPTHLSAASPASLSATGMAWKACDGVTAMPIFGTLSAAPRALAA